jgi:hypothetical protein
MGMSNANNSAQTVKVPASSLIAGMTYVTHYGPRLIKSAGVEREHGKEWLVWRWDRVSRADGIDCGYGGVLASVAADEMVEVLA